MAFSPQEEQLIKYGSQNGKSSAEIQSAIVKLRTGFTPTTTEPTKEQASNLQSRLADVGTKAATDISGAIQGTGKFAGESSVRRGVEATEAGFSAPIKGAGELLPESVRKATGAVGDFIGKGFKAITDAYGSTPGLQNWVQQHPAAAKALEEVTGTTSAAGGIAGDILSVEGARATAQDAVDLTKRAAAATVNKTASVANDAYKTGIDLKNKAQVSLAGKNVEPQLQESAKRLFLEGTDRVGNPVGEYNKYLEQSKKALTDIKADPAISNVGEEMGTAFEKVIGQRKAVGKVMGNELKDIGTIKTNILPDVDTFVKDLEESGLVYDRVAKAVTQTTRQSKMGATDIDLLETYAKELQGLGSKPTISELDAFMSRIPKDIDVYKASKNLTGTTNAERIVKKSLAGLREQFDPVATGNKALEPYSNARSAYHELSDFLEEGESFVGKKTQTGDFAKDASLMKSAVQSVLNNGKKDWLIKLESLTGHKLIDKAVLALQAMKDAGDFRGLSLLQILGEGSVPLSKASLSKKIIDFALQQGSKALIGSPEEQTRAFLKSLNGK